MELHRPFLKRSQPIPLESLASLMNRIKRDNYYEEENWLESLLLAPVPDNLNLVERLITLPACRN